jgi:rhamnogalacturonan endolyase
MKRLAATAFALLSVSALGAELSGVRFEADAQTMKLANSEVQLAFDLPSGKLRSLLYHDREMLAKGGGYVQIAPAAADPADRAAFTPRVVRRQPDLVEIAFSNDNPRFPFELESHFILRGGEPGFHQYLVLGHDAVKHPGVQRMAQFNYALRLDPQLFTWAAVDDARIREFPKPSALIAKRMVMDATYPLEDGSIYSKYFYSAAMDENHRVHGAMGDGIGAWVIMPSHEHLNGGPEHQELTVHQTDSGPVLLRHYNAAHYGAGELLSDSKDGSWRRASATWMFYFNSGADRAALWQDAKKRAQTETAEWPYPWLDDAQFQLHRGAVSGRLAFDDHAPAAEARIILAPHEDIPSPFDWQRQWKGYRFYGWADPNGRFSVPKVRPGLYDLYAWKRGVIGEFIQRGVRVGEGETANVGDLTWKLPRNRETLWQIGVPDRTSAEFGFAGNFRQWKLWDKIAEANPSGVTFVVGKSTVRDLPFEMAVTQNEDNSWRAPEWRVEFNIPAARSGKAWLSLALASAESESSGGKRGPELRIALNGEPLSTIDDLASGGAANRSGAWGLYQLRQIEFDAAKLKSGANVLTLELPAPQRPAGKRLGNPAAAVQWDCLRLEAEAK